MSKLKIVKDDKAFQTIRNVQLGAAVKLRVASSLKDNPFIDNVQKMKILADMDAVCNANVNELHPAFCLAMFEFFHKTLTDIDSRMAGFQKIKTALSQVTHAMNVLSKGDDNENVLH